MVSEVGGRAEQESLVSWKPGEGMSSVTNAAGRSRCAQRSPCWLGNMVVFTIGVEMQYLWGTGAR